MSDRLRSFIWNSASTFDDGWMCAHHAESTMQVCRNGERILDNFRRRLESEPRGTAHSVTDDGSEHEPMDSLECGQEYG